MVHFYSKKCIFRWGLKRALPWYISVEKYAGTDRVNQNSFVMIDVLYTYMIKTT